MAFRVCNFSRSDTHLNPSSLSESELVNVTNVDRMTYESSGSPSNVSPPVHFYPSIITEDDPGIWAESGALRRRLIFKGQSIMFISCWLQSGHVSILHSSICTKLYTAEK